MSNAEIKQQLIEGIETIDDKDFLMALKELMDNKYSVPKVILSDWQLERIAESKAQIERGELMSHEDVTKLVQSWLEK